MASEMKIKLEIDIPEYDWVDVPVMYGTHLGGYDCYDKVKQIQQLIEYLQRLDDIQNIINSNTQHVRNVFCRAVIAEKLKFIEPNQVYYVGEQLSNLLGDFVSSTGLNFHEFDFEDSVQVLSNGKKIKFKHFDMLFNTEHEAFKHIVKIYTSKSDFNYDVVK